MATVTLWCFLYLFAAAGIVSVPLPRHATLTHPEQSASKPLPSTFSHPEQSVPESFTTVQAGSDTPSLSNTTTLTRFCYSDKCTCTDTVANCSNNHGNLTFIPELPKGIRTLLFSFNNLTSIGTASFFRNVYQIKAIDLGHNGLTFIHPDAFKPLSKLLTLTLDHNNLTYETMVPIFSAMKLKRMYVRHMRLQEIPRAYFFNRSLKHLEHIDFSGNFIHYLNLSEFSALAKLRSLVVNNSRISATTVVSLPQLRRLSLQDNALYDLPDACDDNHSSLLPNLSKLNFAQNKFSDFTKEVCFPSLRFLDLSKNPIAVLKTGMFNSSRFPSLTNLRLQTIQPFQKIEKFAFRSLTLESLSLMFCNIPFSEDMVHRHCFRGIPQLTHLELSHNLGSYIPDKKFRQLFGSFKKLQYLNLGTNGIKEINKSLFRGLEGLTQLFLYRNKLTDIPDGTFDSLKNLKELKLGDNELTEIRESTFSPGTRKRLRQLDLSGNLFFCDCDLLWFKNWFVSSPSLFAKSYRDYTCKNLKNTPLQTFTMRRQVCLWSHEVYNDIFGCCTLFIALLVIASAVHHFRWHIRLMLAFKGHGDIMRRRLQAMTFDYDIFVSFAGEDLPWVRKRLIPKLEGELGLRLCIHERDFIPGKNILSNIVDCVKASKRFLVVFSQHFAQSPWCQFELDLCLGHVLDSDDTLIVTCLGDVMSRDLTSTMGAVLSTTTYLQWRDNPDVIRSFWHRLTLSLRNILPSSK